MPCDALSWAKVRDGFFHFCRENEGIELLENSIGTHKIHAVITPYWGRFSSSGNKSSEAGNERFSGEMGNKFQVNCLYWHWYENAHIQFQDDWFTYGTLFEIQGTCKIQSNVFEYHIGCVRSGGSCPIIWGFALGVQHLQITQLRTIERIAVCPPRMCKLQNKEEDTSNELPWRRRMCSEQISSLVSRCLGSSMIGCLLL